MARTGDLRIGTSGWSYPTGAGTWKGIFYPPKAGRGGRGTKGTPRPKFDELAYYAERFDTVEINSSFYGTPTPETTSGWAARTPKDFEFSLKLYQKFTHPRMFKEAALKRTPLFAGDERRPSSAGGKRESESGNAMLDLLAEVNEADIDQFRRALDPLANAGKLGALLAQFPPSFKADSASIDYLTWLLDVFRDYRVAVELRHRTWSDDLATTLALLNGAKAAFVQIDEPKFRVSIRQNFLPNLPAPDVVGRGTRSERPANAGREADVSGFYYLRLHGRNAQQWWHHANAEDRYNYLYSQKELDPFVEVADAVRTLVKKMYLYTNNHFAGKSVANAAMLKQRLGLPVDGEYPDEFVEHYPETRGIVRTPSTEREPTAREGAEPEEAGREKPDRKEADRAGANARSRVRSSRSLL